MKKFNIKIMSIARPAAVLLSLVFIIPILSNISLCKTSEDHATHYGRLEMSAALSGNTYAAAEESAQASSVTDENAAFSGVEGGERDSDSPIAEEKAETVTVPPASENGQVIGRISVPSVNLSDTLAVGTSLDGAQDALINSAAIMCYGYMGLPEQAAVSVVGGHNYMEFNKLKNAEIGDDVILELDWGVFEYTVYDILIQSSLSSAPQGNLVIYTCHPFDERHNPTGSAYFLCAPKTAADEQAGQEVPDAA